MTSTLTFQNFQQGAAPAAAAAKTAVPSAYDNVGGVTQQMVQDLLSALKAEGVSLEGKVNQSTKEVK